MGLIDLLRQKLEPKDALIFYNCDSGMYVEHRSIEDGKMGAGHPLDISQFSQMVRLVERYAEKQQKMTSMCGVVPQNMLYADPNLDSMRLVWWRGPEERKMYFTKNLGIPDGVMKVPGMIYSVKGSSLSVWCFKGSRPRGRLYRAPFFNVYQDGRVCLGSSKTQKPKDNTFDGWIAYWEKMFWQSEFAHLISENPIEGNLAAITKKCIEKGVPFPVDVLTKANVKLNDILK